MSEKLEAKYKTNAEHVKHLNSAASLLTPTKKHSRQIENFLNMVEFFYQQRLEVEDSLEEL